MQFNIGDKIQNSITGRICTVIAFISDNSPVVEYYNDYDECCVAKIPSICSNNWKKINRKGTVWVNIYENKSMDVNPLVGSYHLHSSHHTRLRADEEAFDRVKYRAGKRIACIEVPWEEGMGL